VDYPPEVQVTNPDGTPCPPTAHFPSRKYNEDTYVTLSYYSGSLQGCSVHIGADGKATVVDANGKPLFCQPNVQLANPDGSACNPKAYFFTGGKDSSNAGVDLPYYSPSLQGCTVTVDADGKPTVIDVDGKPLAVQPIVQLVNPDGSPCPPKAYYYAGGKDSSNAAVDLPYYSGSLEGCTVNYDKDGKPTVIGADGKPLAVQPVVQLVDGQGKPCTPTAYYGGGGQGAPSELKTYSAPLAGFSVWLDKAGNPVVLDEFGAPLAVQPIVQLTDEYGKPLLIPKACYWGDKDNPIDLPFYSGSPKKYVPY
jgi:hypothetical protein